MLFIENEPFKLPEPLETEIRGVLRNGKTLAFPKGAETKTVDSSGNPVTEYPSTRSVPYVAFVDLDMDTFKTASASSKNVRYVQVRYCESVITEANNIKRFKPASLLDLITLQPQNAELYWFLYYVSPYVQNGLNAKANKLKSYSVVIDDPEKDEKEQAERDALIFRTGNMIMSPEKLGGLKEEKLRNIAAAFGITDSVKGRLDGIKLKLRKAVEKDEIRGTASGDSSLKGYRYFLKLAEEDYDFDLIANISKAVEMGIIEYSGGKRGWYFLAHSEPGTPRVYEEKIVNCEPTVESKEIFLKDFLARTPLIKERLLSKLEEKIGGENTISDNDTEYENLKSQKSKLEEDGDIDAVIEVVEKMLSIKPKNPKLREELKTLKTTKENA